VSLDFFLDGYMNKLKAFVHQREKPEGYMEKGYILYEFFYYVGEYIKHIDNIPGALIWDEEKIEGEILQTNGKRCLINSK
jgi:hypothetical protein